MAKEGRPPECQRCGRTDDLVRCPECGLLFCREHDPHECFPRRGARFQEQIDVALKRKKYGVNMFLAGVVLGLVSIAPALVGLVGIVFGEFWVVHDARGVVCASMFVVAVLLLVFGHTMVLHYEGQLQKLGIRKRRIRP